MVGPHNLRMPWDQQWALWPNMFGIAIRRRCGAALFFSGSFFIPFRRKSPRLNPCSKYSPVDARSSAVYGGKPDIFTLLIPHENVARIYNPPEIIPRQNRPENGTRYLLSTVRVPWKRHARCCLHQNARQVSLSVRRWEDSDSDTLPSLPDALKERCSDKPT